MAYVPRMRTQLVAARTVAETLADMVAQPGLGRDGYLEVAGPRLEFLPEMATLLAERRVIRPRTRRSATTPTPTPISTRTAACCPSPPPCRAALRSRSGSTRRPRLAKAA